MCNMHVVSEKFARDCSQKTEGNRSLGGPRCEWEDDIKMDRLYQDVYIYIYIYIFIYTLYMSHEFF
jgi:hypothetical protein